MKIDLIRQNINFKQIKLTEAEFKNAQNLYNQIKIDPSDLSKFLKTFDIFEPHLNKEVVLKQKESSKARKIFSVTLFIKFFEILERSINRLQPIEAFLENLNKYSNNYTLKESDKDKKLESDYNVSTVNDTITYISNYLDMPKEKILNITKNNNSLYHLDIDSFKNDINVLKKHFNLNEEEIFKIYRKNPFLIIQYNRDIIENTNYMIDKLKIDKETFLKQELFSHTLTMTKEKFDKRISDLTNFLNVEEAKVISMLPRQKLLLTLPLESIMRNFDSMQSYLGVDRNKMSEIAVMAPINIAQDFDERISDLQNVMDTLNISFDKFVNNANNLPSMYRTTFKNLNVLINYISKNLGLSKEEATTYLAINNAILSYRLTNIENNKKNNFEVLNKELDIDQESYIEIMKKNSRILGAKSSMIEENLKLITEIFEVDKNTLFKMINENPFILTTHFDYVINCISENSEFFNINIDDYIKICIKYPKLITRCLKNNLKHISIISELRNVKESELIDLCKKNPEMLNDIAS